MNVTVSLGVSDFRVELSKLPKVIGIVGGGQLGKMLALSAVKMGFKIAALDPSPTCPISSLADRVLAGSLLDGDLIHQLASFSDVLTFEIEHINTEALKEVSEVKPVYPDPATLELIKDKLRQREFLATSGFPVPSFKHLPLEEQRSLTPPFVQKARFGGYDGRGVVVVRKADDITKLLTVESYVEDFVNIEKELAVVVARNTRGQIKAFPPVEMVFDERANILSFLLAPARVDEEVCNEMLELARDIVEKLEYVGVLAIELFLSSDGKLYVNELAPRVHNSGHHTIEACITSQFEQHIRAITGLPLGETEQKYPAAMVNLLGEPGYCGSPILVGLRETLEIPGVSVHIYGKEEVRPFRKMGHVTIVGPTVDDVVARAKLVKETLKIIGDQRC